MKADTILFLSILGLAFLIPKLVHGQAIPNGGNYLAASDVQVEKIIAPPPGNYSTQTANEIKAILQMQKQKTVVQVAAVREQDTLTPYLICGTSLPLINAQSPRAIDLLLKVGGDVKAIAEQGKEIWDRPRPARLDKRIEKLVDMPPDSSYPGTNSTVIYTWAAVLSELVPEKKDVILAKADEIAQNRVLAGAQYPSDIAAAKTLGEAIAKKLLDQSSFQQEFQGVRQELAARMAAQNAAGVPPLETVAPMAAAAP